MENKTLFKIALGIFFSAAAIQEISKPPKREKLTLTDVHLETIVYANGNGHDDRRRVIVGKRADGVYENFDDQTGQLVNAFRNSNEGKTVTVEAKGTSHNFFGLYRDITAVTF